MAESLRERIVFSLRLVGGRNLPALLQGRVRLPHSGADLHFQLELLLQIRGADASVVGQAASAIAPEIAAVTVGSAHCGGKWEGWAKISPMKVAVSMDMPVAKRLP